MIFALIVVLAAGSVVILVVPELQFAIVAPELDVAINTSATLVAIAVAGLAWSRWRESGTTAHFLEAAAFVILLLSGLASLWFVTSGTDVDIGMSLSDPNQTPLYVRMTARLIAGALLLLAVWPVRREIGRSGAATWIAAIGTAYLSLVVVYLALGERLPELIDSEGLARLRDDPTVPSELPGITPLGALVHVGGASMFLLSAAMIGGRGRPSGVHPSPYFAAGLVLAGFGDVHAAFYPGTYTSLVTTADILRLAFYGVLLVGINADARADLRALRFANAELAELRTADVARAALEERARLAREIHDGVAQELWLARLKAGHLADERSLDDGARRTLDELTTAIDAGLADAGHAVIALRARVDRPGVVPILEEYAAEFTARFGVDVRIVADEGLPTLDPHSEAESLRIVQEALNNARKHADATLVQIQLQDQDGRLRIAVADNGRGFDPATTSSGFGLQSMAERARLIGAQLDVRSAPSDGTVLTLDIPISTETT